MVKGILFDLDGTLLDRASAVRGLLGEQHREFSSALANIPREQYINRVFDLDTHGTGDLSDVYRQIANEFRLPVRFEKMLMDHFLATYHSCCQSFPEAVPTLVRLRSEGLRLGVVTNGTVRVQEPALERVGISDLVDVVLISEREGVRKPEHAIFDRAVAGLGVSAVDAWFVGDNPVVDIAGAHAAGLTGVWRHSDAWPPPDVPSRTIFRLDELIAMVLPSE